MKTVSRLLLGLLLLAAANTRAGDWKLVWSDEFNYHGLPDPAKWDYEEGFVRNHEKQYYTRARLENARVEDGMLVLECRKEHYTPPGKAPVDYTAASLITRGKASWQYGRIEVRAKLPRGKGVWPAIWMLGDNHAYAHWPFCGEIDIMEFIGKAPDAIHGTVHFALNGKHQSETGTAPTVKPWEDFHLYGLEWTPQRIDFLYDGKSYKTFQVSHADQGTVNPFRAPQYLLLNFALGGSWGGPVDDAVLPQKFLIDYVRVYQRPETGN